MKTENGIRRTDDRGRIPFPLSHVTFPLQEGCPLPDKRMTDPLSLFPYRGEMSLKHIQGMPRPDKRRTWSFFDFQVLRELRAFVVN